jgi:hypothetical protein
VLLNPLNLIKPVIWITKNSLATIFFEAKESGDDTKYDVNETSNSCQCKSRRSSKTIELDINKHHNLSRQIFKLENK